MAAAMISTVALKASWPTPARALEMASARSATIPAPASPAMTPPAIQRPRPAIPSVAAALGAGPEAWRIREVGDGNLNLVFIVEGPGGGVVVKQALPYLRLVGESWPLPLERSYFESLALTAQAQATPRLVPRLYATDRVGADFGNQAIHLRAAETGPCRVMDQHPVVGEGTVGDCTQTVGHALGPAGPAAEQGLKTVAEGRPVMLLPFFVAWREHDEHRIQGGDPA